MIINIIYNIIESNKEQPMVYINEEYKEGIAYLLANDDERYTDSRLSREAFIKYITENGDPKKRFGILYYKVVHGIETPLESKIFGRSLTRAEAEDLAMHFIIKQEEENPLIVYGDPVVTEYLNYFSLEDGDVINGYHWLIEEDEYV